MNLDYDMGTGRNELMWKISHDEETEEEVIEEINKCSDVNYTDAGGFSYLDFAALNHKTKIIKALLEKGANPNGLPLEKGTSRNGFPKKRNVAILYALGRNNPKNPEILKLFLEYGVDLDMVVNGMSIREVIDSFDECSDQPVYRPIIEEFEANKSR